MNIFNYESKFNQMVMVLADMIILNLLYLICCIPIFTIGAAQAGLYTAVRAMRDDEDYVGSCYAAFLTALRMVSAGSPLPI